MDTINKIRLNQLLQPFEGPGGIASLNPLAFQYQDQQYLNQDPTQDFYEEVNISPTQNFYPLDRNPTQMFYQPREFVNAPNAIEYYQPDLTTLRGLDMNRFQGVSDRSIIDETTNDEEDQNYIDQVNKNKSTGIMDLIMGIALPGYSFLKNMGKGGFDGIRGLNQRIQQSDFGQSDNFAEFLKRRRDKEALARDPNVFRDARNITSNLRRTAADDVIDRGRGQSFSAPTRSAPTRSAAATRSRDLGSMRGGVGR